MVGLIDFPLSINSASLSLPDLLYFTISHDCFPLIIILFKVEFTLRWIVAVHAQHSSDAFQDHLLHVAKQYGKLIRLPVPKSISEA